MEENFIMKNKKNNFLNKKILSSKYPYIIAEIGINHNGKVKLAKKMMLSAKKNGASCVKFQAFIVDNYISKFAKKARYQKKDNKVKSKSQLEIIKSCEISIKEMIDLKKFAKKIKIDFLCTPFEISSLKALVDIGVEAIKISSCNLTNIPFLKLAAKTKLPILLSTGMANIQEVKSAVGIFKKTKSPLLLLQCTSNYPAKIENSNILVLNTYKKLFKCPVGYSDHTPSILPAIAAISLGASVIEKHFTISKKLPGIDQKASIEPNELKDLVSIAKKTKLIFGNSKKFQTKEEIDTARSLRRSLVASQNLFKGQKILKSQISIKRPGTGIEPKYFQKIVGKKLKKNVKADQVLKFDQLK